MESANATLAKWPNRQLNCKEQCCQLLNYVYILFELFFTIKSWSLTETELGQNAGTFFSPAKCISGFVGSLASSHHKTHSVAPSGIFLCLDSLATRKSAVRKLSNCGLPPPSARREIRTKRAVVRYAAQFMRESTKNNKHAAAANYKMRRWWFSISHSLARRSYCIK
jgi:hypothetical protein